MSKTRLPAILLNHDFFTKGRTRKWIKEHGAEAVIVLQIVWIASSQEKNCLLKREEVFELPYPVSVEKSRIVEILDSAVSVGLLEANPDFYYNSQILNDSKSFEKKRKNYKEGYKKRKRIHDESTLNPLRIERESSLNYIDTDTEYETEYELKKEVSPEVSETVEVTAPEGTPEWYRQVAESELEIPAGQLWTKTNAFINSGRRQLRRYPSLMLSVVELAQVIELYHGQGIPLHLRQIAFQRAEAGLKTKRQNGERVDNLNPLNWLMGFLYTEALQAWKGEGQVKKVLGG